MMEQKEIKRIIRLLKSTAKIAENASFTGMLSRGYKVCVRQYNSIVEKLQESGEISEGLFPLLEEDAPFDEKAGSFDEVGVVCTQLAEYLKEEDESAKSGRKREGGATNVIEIGGELKGLGEVIRVMLPEWKKEELEKKKPEESESAEKSEVEILSLNDLESRISELGSQLQVMAERLRRESLSPDEIQQLADSMRELGDKHAELARQHASLRAQTGASEE